MDYRGGQEIMPTGPKIVIETWGKNLRVDRRNKRRFLFTEWHPPTNVPLPKERNPTTAQVQWPALPRPI
jgi:hypothetical protein